MDIFVIASCALFVCLLMHSLASFIAHRALKWCFNGVKLAIKAGSEENGDVRNSIVFHAVKLIKYGGCERE